MTLKLDVPTNAWSRRVSLIDRTDPTVSPGFWFAAVTTLTVLSSSRQFRPPSMERRKPTPEVPVSPSPVETRTIDWLGSLLRPKTVMPPVFRLLVGPRSVRGT